MAIWDVVLDCYEGLVPRFSRSNQILRRQERTICSAKPRPAPAMIW